jgi:outer membrane protein assembly factor BamB
MKKFSAFPLIAAVLPALAADPAAQWPAWRGPLATGVAPKADPPVEFGEEKNVQWKAAVPGKGSSTPVIWGDQVFILAAIPLETNTPPDAPAAAAPPPERPPGGPGGPGAPGGPGGRRRGPGGGGMSETPGGRQQFVVLSYDRATGRERWRTAVREQVPHEGHHRDHGFASASPVTDGQTLIAHFGSFGTYGLDLEGKKLWEADLGDMRTRNSFGEGSSPALDGETVVILWDHEGEDFIVALDKTTGQERWRQKRDEPTGWSTPVIVEHGGKKQVIVNGTGRVRGYDLATGAPLWEAAGQTVNAIPTPVVAGDVAYVTSGFRGSAIQAIRLGRTGDLTGTDAIVWSQDRQTPYVPSPLLHGGLIYLFSGNNAMLSILDAKDGRRHVEAERLDGLTGVYASPVGAQDRVYLAGRDGGVLVLKRGPQVEVLAKNKFADGFDASPAAVGNQLFLRGREHMYALAEK